MGDKNVTKPFLIYECIEKCRIYTVSLQEKNVPDKKLKAGNSVSLLEQMFTSSLIVGIILLSKM